MLPSVEASNAQPSEGKLSMIYTVYKTYRNQWGPGDHITAIDVLSRHLRK